MKKLVDLFCKWSGEQPQQVEQLAGAGSNRVYYRISDRNNKTYIGVVGNNVEENRAFIALSRHFCKQGLNVPQVLVVSYDEMRYLQTDLGKVSLFDCLKKGREKGGDYDDEERRLLHMTIQELPVLQVKGAEQLDFSVCYPLTEFDLKGVMFDLNYFKYCFLKTTGIEFNEVKLENDFEKLAEDLCKDTASCFLYRDFQARNVMITPDGSPAFIDFQGGRRGPFYYDVASFLWQASARYPDSLRSELVDTYYDSLSQLIEVPAREYFDNRLRLFVFFRLLQVLGAYGFRGYFERKPHFIQSVPLAIDNLRSLLKDDFLMSPYPYLKLLLSQLAGMERFAMQNVGTDNENTKRNNNLVVRIFSFSYKKGIPEDTTGNGGGYVFDCRSTHNPGRYEPYKKLTGLDAPVIKFLEDDGEIMTFLDSVYKLADAHVQRYIERGFTSLMFSFGCTGGQHRSVYSAQHLAEHIYEKFGIEVRLVHREQGISKIFAAKQ